MDVEVVPFRKGLVAPADNKYLDSLFGRHVLAVWRILNLQGQHPVQSTFCLVMACLLPAFSLFSFLFQE